MTTVILQNLEIFIFLALMILGYVFGRIAEKRHYRSIIKREKKLNVLPAIASRIPPEDRPYKQALVIGSVVVSIDYFKQFVATLRNFFGGRVTTYETLLDRARREALLRMKQSASNKNASYVFNVKYETASISKGRKNRVGSIEVLAYGTALIPA